MGNFHLNTLAVPNDWEGRQVDWVLGVKQSTSFFAYLFEDVTLGIDGGFNSFSFQAGQGPNAGDLVEAENFSHASDLSATGASLKSLSRRFWRCWAWGCLG